MITSVTGGTSALSASDYWNTQKNIGDTGESFVAKVLSDLGFCVQAGPSGYHPEYDLVATATIEVKTDKKAAETGNVFVELGDNGQPSGLRVSLADAWVFIVADEILLIPTATLRELTGRCPVRNYVLADGRRKSGALIPVEVLRWCAHTLCGGCHGDAI